MTLSLEKSYPTPLSHSPLLPLLLLSLLRQRHTPNGSTRIKKEYDYVIVGGGSAGSVVANRLSEKPCVRVLLLEAGGMPPLLTEVPALAKYFWFTDVDWKYKTAPQKHTGKSLINRQVVWPSGKMLGGSSSINDMLASRGNKKNYDEWEAMGARGWGYKDVSPFFLKLENNKDHEYLFNGHHASGGPVTLHQPRYESELKGAVYRAATNLGYKLGNDAKSQTGFYEHQATLRDNQRCSTAKAYLVPAENRTNLDILPHARATKLIIKNHQARGVRFSFRGHTYTVLASKEVILSAGTVNTAQLLMLSGIGPKAHLQKLNIPVLEDLPVGQNFHDQAATHVPYVLNSYISDFEEKISDTDNIQEYIQNRTGPLASTSGTSYVATLKSHSMHTHIDLPSYQLLFSEIPATFAKHHFGLKPEVYEKLYEPYETKTVFVCTVSQLQPKSRGSVTLKSKNPYDPPIIDPNYLEDSKDVENLVEGMKTCHRIVTSRPFQKLGARPFETLIPGCERFSYDEEEYLRCQVRSILVSMHNPVGTAKMGDPWDPSTVVDPKLRVKNVKGLRVVDASVMPKVPSGNINIPTIMLAEKASDIIKETIDCYKNWEDSEKLEDDAESWEKPGGKDEEWADDTDEKWEDPEDEDTTWIKEGHLKRPKNIIWVDKVKWKKPEDQWENPKDEWENSNNQWKKPKDQWEKPEDQWKKPEDEWKQSEDNWEKPEDQWKKPDNQWKKPEGEWKKPEDQWKKPEDQWKQSENKWKKPEEIKFEKVNDYDYMKTEVPVYKEFVTRSPEEEKKPLENYFKPPLQASWAQNKDDFSKSYPPPQASWPLEEKYEVKNIPEPTELPFVEIEESSSKPYSWYKQQTNLLMKQYPQPLTSQKDKIVEFSDDSVDDKVPKSIKELIHLSELKNKKSSPGTPWKKSNSHEEMESIDELVRLAERENKEKQSSVPWKEHDAYEATKSVEELVELAKEEYGSS